MKWLQKINVFKRLKNQAELIERLSAELEVMNAPVFFIRKYSPGDDGPPDEELKPWDGALPDLKPITLIGKMKMAEELISRGTGMADLMLVLFTDKGIYRKLLLHSGEINVHSNEDELVATAKWPTIEVGQKVVIHRGVILRRAYLMSEIDNCKNMYLWPGDALNITYTFDAP